MTLSDAEYIKRKVRDFFKEGHKSSNKIYDEAVSKDLQEAKKRNARRRESQKHIIGKADFVSFYKLAQDLQKMPVFHRSGNCPHMAALSAYFTLERGFIARDYIYIAEVNRPGDHIFCLISKVKIKEGTTFSSILDFTRSKLDGHDTWIIIDPWLSVACAAEKYLEMGAAKLDKWTSEGKRIGWRWGSQGPTWYPPNGEYMQVFANEAPVVLTPF